MGDFIDSLKLMFPLKAKDKIAVAHFSEFLGEKEVKTLEKSLKQGKVKIGEGHLGLSVVADDPFHVLEVKNHKEEMIKFIDSVNKKSEENHKSKLFAEMSKGINKIMERFIAPQIVGLEGAKEAAMLQLFSKETVNILLIGDPGTGKTEVLRSVEEIAPIASFGLGSGTSGVGLTVAISGKEMQKGLLPLAHNGIACIDELNLIKKDDLGSLYNAMEKGYVTYDKGGKHIRFDAKVSVLATANPRYSQFLGKSAEQLKKELPFEAALLTRFHLVFFVRKPNLEKFMKITKKILQKDDTTNEHDKSLMKDYVTFAKQGTAELPKELEGRILDFVAKIKKDENKFMVEVNPRMVLGIVRLCKASALMELRDKVTEADVKRVLKIFEESLYPTKTI